jgi:hypothetical protein
MNADDWYAFGADVVLVVHFAIVLFVAVGLVFIIAGNGLAWPWVNGWWFRAAHLVVIGVVVAQAWLGVLCPLTTLENWLRRQAGTGSYAESFIAHWVGRLLFYDAPAWVFTLGYSAFALIVVLVWWRFPPRSGRVRASGGR